jgi:hypothetical protein
MEAADLWSVSDDELIALIERLDTGHDRSVFVAPLNELFGRIRAEAAPDELSHVEVAVARLKRIFSQADDDEGPQVGGIREPRRPPPYFDARTVHLAS